MEPEQSPTPNNAVDSILPDAAPPLYYSRAVRALLGMPEAEGVNPTFARMVPPAGFQYHLHPPTGEASRTLHPLKDTVPSAFDEAQTSELHSSEGMLGEAAPAHRPVEVLRKWLLDTPPPSPPTTVASRPSTLERPPGAQPDAADRYPTPAVDTRTSDHRGLAQRSAQQQAAGAPAEPARKSVAATATAGQPGDVLEHITIAVPGISERSQYFPALAPEKLDDRPASTATASSPQQVVPGDPHRQAAERLSSPDQAQASPTEGTRKVQASANQNEATLPLDLRPWRAPSPAMKGGEAGSMEQLQRTVRELAAQVASWQTRTPHESQRQQTEQQPPRRAERVVIIKQEAQHSGPPRAFWERGYLGHLPWRTVR
jgi:hypothetical protein